MLFKQVLNIYANLLDNLQARSDIGTAVVDGLISGIAAIFSFPTVLLKLIQNPRMILFKVSSGEENLGRSAEFVAAVSSLANHFKTSIHGVFGEAPKSTHRVIQERWLIFVSLEGAKIFFRPGDSLSILFPIRHLQAPEGLP